jgi:hypothetical protein
MALVWYALDIAAFAFGVIVCLIDSLVVTSVATVVSGKAYLVATDCMLRWAVWIGFQVSGHVM